MRDLKNTKDVAKLIDAFYEKAKKDPILSPIFEMRIMEEAWEKHLDRIIDFWNTILFMQGNYKGSPFAMHLDLPIYRVHFDTWVELFSLTVEEHFSGEKADEAKTRAQKMGDMFLSKLEHYRNNPNIKPIQ